MILMTTGRYNVQCLGHSIVFSNLLSMDAGSDGILLGAETLRGLYPVETISIVGKICAEVYYLNISIKLYFS